MDVRQGIAIGVFAGAIIGFLTALFSGAMGLTAITDAADWLQGISSVLALLVSVYVVTQVAKTLSATQEMAEDQRRIGNAQIRPWILAGKPSIIRDPINHSSVANIPLVNFGPTPARFVLINSKLLFDHNRVSKRYDASIEYDKEYRHYIPPTEDFTFDRDVSEAIESIMGVGLLLVKVEYYDINSDMDENTAPFKFEVGIKVSNGPDGPEIKLN